MLYNPQSFDKIIDGSEKKSDLSKEELDLLNDNYITYVGRVEKIKGLEDLIDAYAKIQNDINEKLYIIGTGNETENLKTLVDRLGLNKKILFLGNKSNPYIWMKHAKLFVTTTYGEGLPTTYIESMICGTPVISYDSPTGPKDILGMGKYGCLVKMGDKNSFAIELKNLLKKKQSIELYKENMKEKLKEFKIEIITKKFEDMIERI
ncbi:glycosyltransferase [Cetobacterium somerae]